MAMSETVRPGDDGGETGVVNDAPRLLATLGRRMGAFLIDLLLIYAVIVVIANATGKYVGYSPLGFEFGLVGNLLVFVGALIYFVATEAGLGATVGKLAAGIRVLGDEGGPVGLGHARARNLVRIIDVIPFVFPVVGAVAIWNSRRSQRLGDRLGRPALPSAGHPVGLRGPQRGQGHPLPGAEACRTMPSARTRAWPPTTWPRRRHRSP